MFFSWRLGKMMQCSFGSKFQESAIGASKKRRYASVFLLSVLLDLQTTSDLRSRLILRAGNFFQNGLKLFVLMVPGLIPILFRRVPMICRCEFAIYIYIPAPSKGSWLNLKGFLYGILYHPFGTFLRVQVWYNIYIYICIWKRDETK